jgi:hypothetical protein
MMLLLAFLILSVPRERPPTHESIMLLWRPTDLRDDSHLTTAELSKLWCLTLHNVARHSNAEAACDAILPTYEGARFADIKFQYNGGTWYMRLTANGPKVKRLDRRRR